MMTQPWTIEKILCAATWYDDGIPHVHQPTETGIVFCTHRYTGRHGSDKGDDFYECNACGLEEKR